MPGTVPPQHRYLANLEQRDLLARLRSAAGIPTLILWELVELDHAYTVVIAGPETARKLGIQEGEIIGYLVQAGRAQRVGPSSGEAIVPRRDQAPPARDFIGSLRWKARASGA